MKWRLIIGCTIVNVLLAVVANAQQRYQRWGGGVDDEALHFGFSFHYIHADYKIDLKDTWRDNGYTRVESPFSHNVGLGLLADAKLTENLNLRLQPSLRLMNIDINIYEGNSLANNYEPKIHRSDIGIPLLLKFKSDRKTNMRGYVIGGGELVFNVASGKRYQDDGGGRSKIITNRSYAAYTAGIGFDIYFEYFKMSPEIRWVQSVGNLLNDRADYRFNQNSPLQRLYMRSFQVSLYFE